jgi:serine protease
MFGRWHLVCAVLAFMLFPLASHAQRTAPPDVPTDRLIVKWKKSAQAEKRLERLSQRAGVRLALHRAMSGGAEVMKLDRRRNRGEMRAIAARLAQDPDVEYAVPDEKRFPFAAPSDGYFRGGLQSNLTSMNLQFAWDVTTGAPNLVVAVIDTGILAQHPDLDPARILAGRDFVSESYAANDGDTRDASAADPGDWVSWGDVQDPASPFDSACLPGGVYDSYSSWHGTHMAGIIGAATNNNGNGIAGINWNSKILPVRVLGKCGGYDSDIIDGVRWAAGLPVPGAPVNPTPAKVLNLSLGGAGACNAAWQSAIDQVTALNKVVVAAAGNEGVDFAGVSPASCQGVIAVAAHTAANQRSFYSNFATGAAPNLFSAPGDNIYSTSDGGLQVPLNDGMLYPEYGTSGAAAQVSGIVSLMLSANPALTNAQVLQLLRESSTSLGLWAGSGRIDAFQVVGNSSAFHGGAPVPVSMTINGATEVFENIGAHFYTATVTWSDAAVTPAYPRWSLTAPFAPFSSISSAGLLPEFSVNSDGTATVHASFTANGVTVTADKQVLVKDNRVVSISASGPATVFLSNPAPAKFSATATWRDGRVLGADATWSVFSGAGKISGAGLFFAGALGPVTVRATVGALTFDVATEVVPGAPVPGAITLDCPSESVAGFALDQFHTLEVGGSADIIPLCNGKVVVADRAAQRVDVIDVATRSVARSWSVVSPTASGALINRMERAAGSTKIFMTFFGAGAGLASIDLANPDNPPQYIALPAPYTDFNHAGMLVNGDDDQIWVIHSQFDQFQGLVKVSRYDVATGMPLGTTIDLQRAASYMQYAKVSRILVTALNLSGGGRTAYDVSLAYELTLRQNILGGGILPALSPDGTRLFLREKDMDVADLNSHRGTWSGAEAAGFSPDGKLLAGNDFRAPGGAAFTIYNTERHLKLKSYAREGACVQVATRFSPSGAFVYGYALCGIDQTGSLFWVALGEVATPDPIAFQGQSGVAPGTFVESNAVVLAGFAGSAAISVAGGEYKIDGGAFTSAPGMVIPGNSVVIRAQASAEAYATAVARLQVGTTPAEFRVTTGAALPAQWWNAACPSEEADLGSAAMAFADINPAWDVIALCDGRVLVGNRQLNRIELYDVRARATVKTWLLNATPEVLRPVPGTSKLLVVADASNVASVDLDSGAMQHIAVGGRPWDVFSGEPGQMIAVRDSFPTPDTRNGDRMSFHDLATGNLLAATFLPVHAYASHVRYDSTTKTIWTGDKWHSPARIARYSYNPATHAITETAIQTHDGGASYMAELVLSPDRTLIANPYYELFLGNTTDTMGYAASGDLGLAKRFPSGPSPRAADFRADSAKIVIANRPAAVGVSAVAIYDVATLALERNWIVPHCPNIFRNMRRVRYSPSGKYVYALETCGAGDGDSARLLWVPVAAASTVPVPDAVAFAPKTAALNAEAFSNQILMTGLQGQTLPVTVTNGQFGVVRGPGNPDGLVVSDGDRLFAVAQAHFQPGVTVTATVNIGGTLYDFRVTAAGGAAGADTTPDPFRLFVLKNRPLDTEFISNTVMITGIDAPAPISVAGGTYSINDGPFTAIAGMVNNGQLVTVKLTSANAINTNSAAILTVGGYSTSLSVTTGDTDTTPDTFAFAPRPRVPRSRLIESNPVTITGLDGPVTASVANGAFRVGAGTYTSGGTAVINGDVVRLRVMSSANLGETVGATLSVGPRSATFSVTTGAAVQTDVGADGLSDIVWRNSSTGENYLYFMNGVSIISEGYLRTVPVPHWQIVAMRDFDGNGSADILWRNASTGENYLYLMDGLSIVSEGYLRTVPLAWQVAGAGDVDGDGRADVLWRNSGTGETYVYFMNGLSIASEGYLRTVADMSWQVAGVDDFNGDGRADVLWRNGTSGENYLYLMNGLSIANEGYVRTVPVGQWQIRGIGDFDGDGKADIVWRNASTGENYVYLMSANSITGEGYVRTVADTTWQIVAVGDYDGDGKSDLLWRNGSSGLNYVFPMDGIAIKPTEGYLRSVAPGGWAVQGK